MPLSTRKSHSDLNHPRRQENQSHPHPLKSNSVTANSMRRPTFFLRRQRSKSVPDITFADVSAVEAGLIFSAAERAMARRRRPVSEYSPGRSAALPCDNDDSITPLVEPLAQQEERDVNSTTRLGHVTSHRPTEAMNQSAGSRPASLRSNYSVASSASSTLCSDDGSSVGSAREPESPLTTPTVSVKLQHPQPISPKRMVDNYNLKAYADSIFVFTRTCLNNAVPALPMHLNELIPQIEIEDTDQGVRELDERVSPQRPPLKSHFSDWSQTNTEADIDDDEHSRWSSSVHTPEWTSRIQTPDHSGPMSPDSYFSDTTPRVAQTSNWRDSAASSPVWSTRASSPTRGLWSNRSSKSIQFELCPSPAASDQTSYFANFDSYTATAESQHGLPLDFCLPDIRRPSPLTSGSVLPKHDSFVSSSASDITPFDMRPDRNAAAVQMADVSLRPPSWLIRAIC